MQILNKYFLTYERLTQIDLLPENQARFYVRIWT